MKIEKFAWFVLYGILIFLVGFVTVNAHKNITDYKHQIQKINAEARKSGL